MADNHGARDVRADNDISVDLDKVYIQPDSDIAGEELQGVEHNFPSRYHLSGPQVRRGQTGGGLD